MPVFIYEALGFRIPAGRAGNVKIECPQCRDHRGNPRDRSLSVNLTTGQFRCHHCGYHGSALRYTPEEKRAYAASLSPRRPQPRTMIPQMPIPQMQTPQMPIPQTPAPAAPMPPAAAPAAPRAYPTPAPRGDALAPRTLDYFRARGISPSTLEAFGVRQGVMFSRARGARVSAILFPYYLRGQLRNIKTRSACKEFTLEKGCELLPYHIDAIEGRPECIITEGEIDALSFAECGRDDVISVPNGAGANLAFLDAYMESHLDDKRTIFIAVDTDPAGLRLRAELLRRLGPERCRVVTYGDGCKDANELLQRGGPDALRAALRDAPEPRMDGVASLRDFADELEALYLHGMRPGATVGLPPLDALISFETKRLCVVSGIPGSGKSEFIDQIAERLNLRHGWKFAYFTPENTPISYHAVKLIEKFTGRPFGQRTLPRDELAEAMAYLDENFFYIDPRRNAIADILACAEFLVRRRGIKALVIDPYNRIESQMGDTPETLYISSVLDSLSEFTQRLDLLVILVAHPRKMMRTPRGDFEIPTLYDISGSANFFNKADYGVIIHRDRREDTVVVSVQKVKFKHLGHPGDALFKYDIATGRYAPFTPGEPPDFDPTNHLRDGARIRAPDSPPAPFQPEREEQLPF